MKRLPRPERELATIAVGLDRQFQLAPDNIERLLFHFVILQAETLAAIDVQNLADVAAGLGENQFVSPRFRDALHVAILKQFVTVHTSLLISPSGNRVATLSMTNSSISCAVRFCRAISAMRRQSR